MARAMLSQLMHMRKFVVRTVVDSYASCGIIVLNIGIWGQVHLNFVALLHGILQVANPKLPMST